MYYAIPGTVRARAYRQPSSPSPISDGAIGESSTPAEFTISQSSGSPLISNLRSLQYCYVAITLVLVIVVTPGDCFLSLVTSPLPWPTLLHSSTHDAGTLIHGKANAFMKTNTMPHCLLALDFLVIDGRGPTKNRTCHASREECSPEGMSVRHLTFYLTY